MIWFLGFLATILVGAILEATLVRFVLIKMGLREEQEIMGLMVKKSKWKIK